MASDIPSADKTINKNFQFFTKIKKDLGIEWLPNKEYKVVHVMGGGSSPLLKFEKQIFGSRKGSTMKQPDYTVDINITCTGDLDTDISENTAKIVLKSYSNNTVIYQWIMPVKSYGSLMDMRFGINSVLVDQLGLSGVNIEQPNEYQNKINAQKISLPSKYVHDKEVYYYQRLTRVKTNAQHAAVLELYLIKNKSGYTPMFFSGYLELGQASGEKVLTKTKTLEEAIEDIDKHAKAARDQKGYVGPESGLYIAEGATRYNWNFVLNKWKSNPANLSPETSEFYESPESPEIPSTPIIQEVEESQSSQDVSQTPQTPQTPIAPRKKSRFDFRKLMGSAQDFEGYFSGEVPDWTGSLIGTPSVDASQISGMFSGTNEAISLVNSYTSDALKNVAYIFNFSKGGAYGVYIPELDKAIKTKALQKQLEQKGYKIIDQHGVLTAYPTKAETTPEQIDKDIDELWQQLNTSGGSALGINMGDVLRATGENTAKIMDGLRSQTQDVPPQIESILKEVLGVYHLAAIILHESSHAKGGDEPKAQNDEHAFRSWAQAHLNRQYQSKLSAAGLDEFYSPLELGTEVLHAVSKSWYKEAQGIMGRLNYSPAGGAPTPNGSDIRGRYNGQNKSEGFAEWAMLVQQDQSIPIEQRLNRSNMAPLEKDVDQENDIIEEQLRKQFKNDSKPNVQLIVEELLAPARDESQGYKAMETMLEEQRPQPLMLPLQKAAMNKLGGRYNGLFGWYNNLDLADGSTIPGLSDRVMAWDDRDESFSAEEQWIKSQERYNPEYDLKGFYYRWIEPRFKPELFDNMTKDYVNTHPAKRFGSKLDPEISRMLSVIKLIEESIINEKIKATRLVITEELADMIKRLLGKEGLKLRSYKVANSDNIFAIWVYGRGVSESGLDKAEQYFQNVDGSEQYKDLAEDLLSGKSIVTLAVEEIVNTTKELCKEYDVEYLYITGEYARKIFSKEATPFVSELNFTGMSIDATLKIGNMLSDRLNVPRDFVINGKAGLVFPYKGVRVLFSKSPYLPEMGQKMMHYEYDRKDPVLRDICNKDFTINMMAYSVREMKVVDPIGVKSDVENKIVKTLFDPLFVVETNPMVIMRAIALKLEGYTLDEDLERSMIECSTLLSSGRFSPQRLKFTREYLKSKGTSDLDSLLDEYGLILDKEKEI